MPNSCFNPNDLIVPMFDTNAKTMQLAFHIHPGQRRLLEYLANSKHLPFRDIDDVSRWCICWGSHCLLGPPPNTFALIEAKLNVIQDERLQEQRDCISVSVEKYVAQGQIEAACRLVTVSYQNYLQIPSVYWRTTWLETLEPAIELLHKHGIDLRVRLNRLSGSVNSKAESI